MKRRLVFLPFLLLLFQMQTVTAFEAGWTEKKLGKVIIKADRAARQKNWSRAIEYGEKVLEGSAALDQESDARYIGQLQNLNRYYDKANRLSEVADRVKKGYELATKNLNPRHHTTMMSRTLYYKLHIINKNYRGAIPLVLENISLAGKGDQEDYRKLYYLEQLYSLYAISGQFEKEERVLHQYLELNRQMFGDEDEDSARVLLILAQNYCRRKLLDKFKELTATYGLQYVCY